MYLLSPRWNGQRRRTTRHRYSLRYRQFIRPWLERDPQREASDADVQTAPVAVLAVRTLLAPCFVVLVSLAARHFGARIGGLLAGLPVIAGPILLVLALQHGTAFASR